jgi:hypothetical protein
MITTLKIIVLANDMLVVVEAVVQNKAITATILIIVIIITKKQGKEDHRSSMSNNKSESRGCGYDIEKKLVATINRGYDLYTSSTRGHLKSRIEPMQLV